MNASNETVTRSGRGWLSIGMAWPLAMISLFVAIPFGLLVRTSFARLDPATIEGTGWTLDAYAQLAQTLVSEAVVFSVGLAFIVATLSISLALPTGWWISRMGRRSQVGWLIALLTTFALSEVLITFAWQIMLSKKVGISNVAVLLGLLDKPVSLLPSFGAVIACITYTVVPFNILTLYPSLSRLDPDLMEAARTQGASPLRAFCTVVLPQLRAPLASAYTMSLVLALGAYVPPLVLGGPKNWTVGVVISETALNGQNLPAATAISILLLAVTVVLIGSVAWASRVGSRR